MSMASINNIFSNIL